MRVQLCSTLVIALILFCLPLRVFTLQADTSEGHNSSQAEKAKKCEETAKKRGLKGDARAAFVSSCMTAKDSAAATMSPEEKQNVDKATSCEQQADQQGLKGKARKTFVKTCTSK